MNVFKRASIGIARTLLTQRTRNSLFRFCFHLAPQEFEKFAHLYAFAPNMELGLSAIRSRGFDPKTVIDIGAFRGAWSKMAAAIWPTAEIFMIEPNAKREPECRATADVLHATLHEVVLGAEVGTSVAFNIMSSGSSVMSERSPVEREVETRELATLDSLLETIVAPALVKIDAQGYELEILKGASRSLNAVAMILLEVALIEINEGAPLLHNVIAFMEQLDFVVYDVLEIHRRPLDGALNQLDLIFVRKNSSLISDTRHWA